MWCVVCGVWWGERIVLHGILSVSGGLLRRVHIDWNLAVQLDFIGRCSGDLIPVFERTGGMIGGAPPGAKGLWCGIIS
jgi:hypothetical protein